MRAFSREGEEYARRCWHSIIDSVEEALPSLTIPYGYCLGGPMDGVAIIWQNSNFTIYSPNRSGCWTIWENQKTDYNGNFEELKNLPINVEAEKSPYTFESLKKDAQKIAEAIKNNPWVGYTNE